MDGDLLRTHFINRPLQSRFQRHLHRSWERSIASARTMPSHPPPSTSTKPGPSGSSSPSLAFSDLSINQNFLVTSYKPRVGELGTLLTVTFSYEKSLQPDLRAKLEARMFVGNVEVPHKAFEGSNGDVTLKCLLSNSLSDLRGPIPLRVEVYNKNTILFDSCAFGEFNLVNPQVAPTPLRELSCWSVATSSSDNVPNQKLLE